MSGFHGTVHDFMFGELEWVNATIASANKDGSYRLDVKVDTSPRTLDGAGEEGPFQTRVPEDFMKTRVPAEWVVE